MSRRITLRRLASFAALGALVAGLVVAPTSLAAAAPSPDAPPSSAAPGPGTEATIVDMVNRSGLFGGTVPSATAQTPYPTSGLQNQRSVTTAEIILDDPATPSSQDLSTYCIDLDTDTTIGVHYDLGEWSEANVPNLPYVQWILEHSYPQVPSSPSGTAPEKVRAVQGAIWYFTDQFVVNRFYPSERAAVQRIVEAAQAALGGGTPPAPVLPTLTVTPASLTGALPGDIVGPFTVGGTVASATIDIVAGTDVYGDAAGTLPVVSGAEVAPGDQLWARYDPDVSPEGFTVETTATVPAGNVFLYNGDNPPRTAAQKLVLAADAEVALRATAEVLPPPGGVGTLDVDVVVEGAAAGLQSEIVLETTCVDGADSVVIPSVLPARTPAGTHLVASVPNLPAGTVCTVVQTDDGGNPFVIVTADVGAPVAIVAGVTSTITVTDEYALPAPPVGALRVDLSIAGPGAGQQSEIQLLAACTIGSGAAAERIERVIDVPAGATGTAVPVATIGDLPPGTTCEVTQTVDGRNDLVSATSSTIDPATVSIGPGDTSVIAVTDVYAPRAPVTGGLVVDVRIDGPAAGLQDAIVLVASCTLDGETDTFPIVVEAGATGLVRAAALSGIESASTCTVTQTDDGANPEAVLSSSSIVPTSVVIGPDEDREVLVTDVFAAPSPTPTPTPTPTPPGPTPSPTSGGLPATGAPDASGWALAAGGIVLIGGLALLVDTLRRRRRAGE